MSEFNRVSRGLGDFKTKYEFSKTTRPLDISCSVDRYSAAEIVSNIKASGMVEDEEPNFESLETLAEDSNVTWNAENNVYIVTGPITRECALVQLVKNKFKCSCLAKRNCLHILAVLRRRGNEIINIKPSKYRISKLLQRGKEGRSGKKKPRKLDEITPFTFSQEPTGRDSDSEANFHDSTLVRGDKEDDIGYKNTSSTESEEEVVQNIEHDNRYRSIFSWNGINDLPDRAKLLFGKISDSFTCHPNENSLNACNCIDDLVIDDFIRVLIDALEAHDSILLFHSVLYQCLVNRERISKAHQCLRFLADNEAMNKDLILVVMNPTGAHWLLGCIVWKSKTAYIFNSMTLNDDRCFKHLMKIVSLSHAIANIPFLSSNWRMILASDSYKQRNSFDCGVFTCFHAASLIIKKTLPYNNSKDARNWIRWVISQKIENCDSSKRLEIDDCVMRRLRQASDPIIEWKIKPAFDEIIESVVHEKDFGICSAVICERPKSDNGMKMCISCRLWFHSACQHSPTSIYFVCERCENLRFQ